MSNQLKNPQSTLRGQLHQNPNDSHEIQKKRNSFVSQGKTFNDQFTKWTGKNAKDSKTWPGGMEPNTLFCAKAAIKLRMKLRIMITTNDT